MFLLKISYYAILWIANITISSAFLVSPRTMSSYPATTVGGQLQKRRIIKTTNNSILFMDPTTPVGVIVDDGEGGDEEIEPGKMRVSEIKAELDMRGISYAGCFDKESLVTKLQDARSNGKANPEIIDKFNKQMLEDKFSEKKLEVKDEDLEKVVANDGTLPGGMEPEMFKKMVGNPEVMALMQSPKLQDAMKLMMSGGQEELAKAIKNDPELQEVVKQLDGVMKGLR